MSKTTAFRSQELNYMDTGSLTATEAKPSTLQQKRSAMSAKKTVRDGTNAHTHPHVIENAKAEVLCGRTKVYFMCAKERTTGLSLCLIQRLSSTSVC